MLTEKALRWRRKASRKSQIPYPVKGGLGQMLNSEGNLLIATERLRRRNWRISTERNHGAYPAMPYFNICTIYYNLKRGQEAVAACDLAISYDPKMADAYYIKGAILFGKGHLEHGKYVAPPGTLESLNKYLEYAPLGEHVRTVNEMVKQLGAKNRNIPPACEKLSALSRKCVAPPCVKK